MAKDPLSSQDHEQAKKEKMCFICMAIDHNKQKYAKNHGKKIDKSNNEVGMPFQALWFDSNGGHINGQRVVSWLVMELYT